MVANGLKPDIGAHSHPTVVKSNPIALIEVFEPDLDDYISGTRFSKRVKKRVTELDILLNNAGTVRMSYHKSASGHEQTM